MLLGVAIAVADPPPNLLLIAVLLETGASSVDGTVTFTGVSLYRTSGLDGNAAGLFGGELGLGFKLKSLCDVETLGGV